MPRKRAETDTRRPPHERAGHDGRGGRAGRGGAILPRIVLIALCTGLAVALVGAGDGIWLTMPGLLLAGSMAAAPGTVIASAAPVMAAGVAAAALGPPVTLPPLWLLVLVPAASLMVLHAAGQRLRRERDAMAEAAFSDPLTGMANRRMLQSRVAYEVERHLRAGERFTLALLDLDGFKLLNDRYGHAAGDEMLCDVAMQLKRTLRGQDTVARLGGDEFCVIAPETANPRPLADRIAAAVAGASAGQDDLRVSVGTAVFPEDGATIEVLLQAADERLLEAKRRLRGGAQRRAA